MKKLENLKIGEQIFATVIEVLPEAALIVSIDGELFRVLNDSGLQMKVQDQLCMTVTSLHPTMFRMQKRDKKKIDRFV